MIALIPVYMKLHNIFGVICTEMESNIAILNPTHHSLSCNARISTLLAPSAHIVRKKMEFTLRTHKAAPSTGRAEVFP